MLDRRALNYKAKSHLQSLHLNTAETSAGEIEFCTMLTGNNFVVNGSVSF